MLGVVLAAAATRGAERESDDGPQWPNVRLDDVGALRSRVNPRPAFADPAEVENRIMGRTSGVAPKSSVASKSRSASNPAPAAQDPAANGLDAYANGGAARWPTLPPEKLPAKQLLSPFVFEAGARYWYSSGSINFGFSNGSPLFGNPTSTLDWRGLSAHSGEVFARVDHIPSGAFVKGVIGGGSIVGGHIDDRDFLANQFRFSDTTSDVSSGNLSFGMVDVGWAYSPAPGVRLGVFAGYHFWREKVTANGIVCNQDSFIGCTQGSILVDFNTPVLTYEPTWHAVRLGVEGTVWFGDGWSVSGEIAGVPYAALQNKDSHLLRQSMADLGPAPNIITETRYAYGIESEVFLNYAVTPNIEVGGGLRYWGLASRDGSVRFGPNFATSNTLNNFDQQRYGVLLHVKGTF
jgi:hypothetical protein